MPSLTRGHCSDFLRLQLYTMLIWSGLCFTNMVVTGVKIEFSTILECYITAFLA